MNKMIGGIANDLKTIPDSIRAKAEGMQISPMG